MCTFCRSLTNPEMEYNCDDDPPSKKDKSEQGLSPEDQRVSSSHCTVDVCDGVYISAITHYITF